MPLPCLQSMVCMNVIHTKGDPVRPDPPAGTAICLKNKVLRGSHNQPAVPPTDSQGPKCRVPQSAGRAADRLLALPWSSPYTREGLPGACTGLPGAYMVLRGPCSGTSWSLHRACLGAIWILLARYWTILGVSGALVWVS